MRNNKRLEVFYQNMRAGTLAFAKDRLIAFEYDNDFIQNGFSISPISLPLIKRVFIPKAENYFNGLFGVFYDSLPDGWGRLLTDRYLLQQGIRLEDVSILDRLSFINDLGMGALSYKPEYNILKSDKKAYDLDILAAECAKELCGHSSDNLDELFSLAGSSGGARPKILIEYNGSWWIIKFPNSNDPENIGEMEYNYNLTAKECNIEIPEIKLFPSKKISGYFGVKRFDRIGKKKIHMVSAGGLLETTHRIPSLDYDILTRLTMKVTNSMEEVKKLYKRMVFNVFSHNRDDHAKNFSFLYDDIEKRYKLSPAYDLTFSSSLNGWHATTVNNKGINITDEDILSAAKNADIDKAYAKKVLNDIKEKTQCLRKYMR